MNIIYNIISVCSLAVTVIAGFKDKTALAGLCFLSCLAFLFMANLKNIKSAKASKDGFEIEAREIIEKAEVTIHEMQELAKLVAKTSLSLIKRSGRLSSYPEEEQEALKDNILSLLSQLNISSDEQNFILEEYNKFIEIDYVFLLLGNQHPTGWSDEDIKIWKKMSSDVLNSYPSPQEIEELLERNNSLTDKHKEILDDYKYFQEKKKYRRPEIISKHKDLRNEIKLITNRSSGRA